MKNVFKLSQKINRLIYRQRFEKIYYLKAAPGTGQKPKFSISLPSLPRLRLSPVPTIFGLTLAIGLVVLLIVNHSSSQNVKAHDLQLYPAPRESNYLYQNTTNGFKVYLGDRHDEAKPRVKFEEKDSSAEFSYTSSPDQKTKLEKESNSSIVYKNISPTVDMKYSLTEKGVKEEIILNDKINTNFVFNLNLKNAVPKKSSIDKFSSGFFIDPNTGEYVFHIPQPFMVDAVGNKSEAVELKIDTQTTMSNEGNQILYTVTLIPNQEWLQSAVYPVTIDPSIVHDESSEFTGTTNRIEDKGSGTNPKLRIPYHELPADEHTVGLWHINETANDSCSGGEDTCDSSGNGFHGTATGTTITTSNQKLGAAARDFNGSSDVISMGDQTGLESMKEITIEAWVKADAFASGSQKYIVGKETVYKLDINDNGTIRFLTGNGTSWWTTNGINTSSNTITTGAWYHIAATCDGAIKRIYINGKPDLNSWAVTENFGGNTRNFSIGAYHTGSGYGNYFDGLIDEVRISDTARTAEEIKQDAQRFPYGVYSSDTIDLTSGNGTVASLDSLEWTDNVSTPGATLDGYPYFKPVIIDNTKNANELTNYQVKVDVDYDSNMQSDFDDLRFTSQIQTSSYGSESTFNSANTAEIKTTKLDSTHFVVAYQDTGGSSYGCAKVGTISGTSITYGDEACFNEAATSSMAIDALDSTHFVVVYTGGYAKIGTVSDTSISYSSAFQFFASGVDYLSVSAISSTQFVVAYQSAGFDGGSNLGTISGSSISFGSNSYFNQSSWTYNISTTALDSTHFVVAYRDCGVDDMSDGGEAKIGTISSTSITYGSVYEFYPGALATSVSALDATHFAVVWAYSTNGYAKIGTVSDTSISYSSLSTFNSALTNNIGVSSLSPNRFMVGYRDDGGADDGCLKVGTISSDIFYGSEVCFNSGNTTYISTLAMGTTSFVAGYTDAGGDTFGHAQVGTVVNTNLDYWIETKTDGAEATVWVEVDTIPASSLSTIWMWYGNGDATASSNGANTFVFFDDFNDGSLNSSLWNSAGTVSESGGVVTITNSGSYIASKTSYGVNYSLAYRGNHPNVESNWVGFISTSSPPFAIFERYATGQWNARSYVSAETITALSTSLLGFYQRYEIERNNGSSNIYYVNNGSSGSGNHTTQVTSNSLPLTAYMLGTGSLYLDWIALRSFTSPEPIVGVGADIEFQTRTSSDGSSWEAWKPTTNESAIASMDSDASNWSTSSTNYLTKTDESTIKMEGAGSLKSTVGQPQSDANTRGLWHFEEIGGSGAYVLDETSLSNDLSVSGTDNVVDGFFGKGRDCTNGSLSCTDANCGGTSKLDYPGSGGWSVGAWVKLDTLASGADQQIAIKWYWNSGTDNGGYVLQLYDTSDVFRFGVANSSGSANYNLLTSTTTPSLNTWYHVVGVYNGLNTKIYVNGILENTAAYSGGIKDISQDFLIGNLTAHYFNGVIDEPFVTAEALTSEEIAEMYRAGRDHRLQKTISSTDLSNKTKVPFYFAADKQGTIAETYVGETDQAVYGVDSSTVALWHLDDNPSDYEGPNSPGTVVDDATIGTVTWSNPTNAKTSNDSDATTSTNVTAYSHYLKATNFGFNIPYNAKILGIQVDIERAASHNSAYFNVQDRAVRIVNGESIGSTNKGATSTNWPTSDAYTSYGNAFDLWGETWTVADVNASNFGVVLSVDILTQSLTTVTAYVDHIRINVWYASIKDESVNANMAKSRNGAAFTQGKIGGARYFDDTDDYLEVSGESNFDFERTDSFSIAAWVRWNGGGQDEIFSKLDSSSPYSGYEFHIRTDKKLGAHLVNTWGSSAINVWGSTILNSNQWYYVAMTYDGTSDVSGVKFYIDGKEETTSNDQNTLNATMLNNITPCIGARNKSAYYFGGTIDELWVSNAVRSADEIRLAYQYGLRTHQITVDYATTAGSDGPTSTSDYEFTPDTTTGLYKGDTVIVRENYNGTTYIMQGEVSSISSGLVTVASWSGTAPSGGYTTNADVFKWQREYWDLNDISPGDRNATVRLGLRILDASEGFTMYLDDFRHNSKYLTDNLGSTITSTANRYIQYRAILSTNNTAVTPELDSVTLDYNRYPTAPTSLYAEQETNPSGITDLNPEFSAVYNDPDEGDVANKYRIQVDDDSGFGSVLWDSGSSGTALTNCAEGSRCEDIAYGGASTDLQWGTKYYWRIKFWDEGEAEGDWSTEEAYFVMDVFKPPTGGYIDDSSQPGQITIHWQDNDDKETGFRIERDVDGGGFSLLTTEAIDATSYVDNTTSADHTYQYRIRGNSDNGNTDWCGTTKVDFSEGDFKFEGVKMEGVKVE